MQKKELGQHWLYDEATLEAMAEAGEVGANDMVLEVGPGLGTLTRVLCEHAKWVVAVEADHELAQNLRIKVPAKNLEVMEGDILEFDFTTLPKGYKVVANIPYYLTAKLIRLLLENVNRPKVAALLVQKEVAERVTAKPGNMSILAVSAQYYAEANMLQIVPKELFDPIPKVDSAILQLNIREKPLFEADTKQFFRLVKAGFGERRKQLKNSLSGGLHISSDEAVNLLEQAGINPNARAQELALQDWESLYNQFKLMEA